MMTEDNYLKLIDFGEAKIVDNYEDDRSKDSSKGSAGKKGETRRGNRRTSLLSQNSDGASSFFGRLRKDTK